MDVKDDTTAWNMVAILLIMGGATISYSYFTLNMVFLLRDPKYFAIDDADQVTEITSTITMCSLILSMTFSVFLGQIYDIVGRKVLILTFFLLTVVTLGLAPFLSPSLLALTIDNMIFTLVIKVLNANPLIPDYVKK